MSPLFSEQFLAFCHNEMFQANLVLSVPGPWNQPFLSGLVVPFSREGHLEAKI